MIVVIHEEKPYLLISVLALEPPQVAVCDPISGVTSVFPYAAVKISLDVQKAPPEQEQVTAEVVPAPKIQKRK